MGHPCASHKNILKPKIKQQMNQRSHGYLDQFKCDISVYCYNKSYNCVLTSVSWGWDSLCRIWFCFELPGDSCRQYGCRRWTTPDLLQISQPSLPFLRLWAETTAKTSVYILPKKFWCYHLTILAQSIHFIIKYIHHNGIDFGSLKWPNQNTTSKYFISIYLLNRNEMWDKTEVKQACVSGLL